MKASLNIGRVFGAEVRLHGSLLLLIPYALIAFRPDSPGSMLRVLLLLVAVFACVALHEIGHTAAARMLGYNVSSIILWPLGGIANFDRRPEKVLPDLIITAAGPITNLLIFAYLIVIAAAGYMLDRAQVLPAFSGLLWDVNLFPVLVGLAAANLSLAVFNLIPVYPLDGGQIARSLLKLVFGERRADSFMLVVSIPAAAALVILGLVLADVLIILTGLLLALAAASLNPRLINGLNMAWLYFFDRALFYIKRNDYDPAVAAYTRAIQRNPNRAGLYASRAVVYFQLAEYALARTDVDCALRLDENHYLAWLLQGELFYRENNAAEALASYNRAIQIYPKGALAYLDRGAFFQAAGDFQRAAQDMETAVALGRGAPLGYLMRSMLRFEMGDLAGARRDAVRAQRYAPHWMLAFSSAFEDTVANHLDWALHYYALAAERMPNAYQVFQGRAAACLANGRPDWALVDYQRALQLSPRSAELLLGRGQAYARLGRHEQAAADFTQAAALADRAHIRRQALAYKQKLALAPAVTAAPLASPGGVPAPSALDDSSSASAKLLP